MGVVPGYRAHVCERATAEHKQSHCDRDEAEPELAYVVKFNYFDDKPDAFVGVTCRSTLATTSAGRT
jgi:hypothetical protein